MSSKLNKAVDCLLCLALKRNGGRKIGWHGKFFTASYLELGVCNAVLVVGAADSQPGSHIGFGHGQVIARTLGNP